MKTAPLSPLGFRVILIGSVKHEFVVLVVQLHIWVSMSNVYPVFNSSQQFLLIYMEQDYQNY
jgi:hypothetical protein